MVFVTVGDGKPFSSEVGLGLKSLTLRYIIRSFQRQNESVRKSGVTSYFLPVP